MTLVRSHGSLHNFAHLLGSRRRIRYTLESTRKIFHEANRGRCLSPQRTDRPLHVSREGSVEKSLSYQARREAFIDADATRSRRPCGFDPALRRRPSFSIEIVDARKNLSCQ